MNCIETAKSTELVDQSTVGGLRVGEIRELGGPFECLEGLCMCFLV